MKNNSLAFERAVRDLRELVYFLQNNVDRVDSKKPYTLSVDFDFDVWLNRVNYCINSIDENWKSSTINLLNWLSENPDTADRLSSVKTPEGIELAIREPVAAQGGYTIEELQKEWAAYVFVLNDGGPRNKDGELPIGFRSFVEFLQIPHEILYIDGGIYTVRFNSKKE